MARIVIRHKDHPTTKGKKARPFRKWFFISLAFNIVKLGIILCLLHRS